MQTPLPIVVKDSPISGLSRFLQRTLVAAGQAPDNHTTFDRRWEVSIHPSSTHRRSGYPGNDCAPPKMPWEPSTLLSRFLNSLAMPESLSSKSLNDEPSGPHLLGSVSRYPLAPSSRVNKDGPSSGYPELGRLLPAVGSAIVQCSPLAGQALRLPHLLALVVTQ